MLNTSKCNSPKQLHFYVNDKELELIKKKQELSGINILGHYLRKMAIDGYNIRLDMKEVREMTVAMSRYSLGYQAPFKMEIGVYKKNKRVLSMAA